MRLSSQPRALGVGRRDSAGLGTGLAGSIEPMSVRRAYAMHQRVLAQWAMDVLALKRKGIDRPCASRGTWTSRSAA